MQEYVLQNRWVYEENRLYYYGLRNKENMFRNTVRTSRAQREILSSLPCTLTDAQKKTLGNLLGTQVVPRAQYRPSPASLAEARFCTCCAANDFIIPGLEFDADGLCPMCQTADLARELKSVVPLIDEIPRSQKSRFDVAVFYTGGKDSTFLLYHLAMQKGLRVLALTWEIPFMSDSARASIQNAKKHFKNVEFISRSVSKHDLDIIYGKLFELSGNTCACPSLAYLLFYPELVQLRVPYFVVGNEPVQMLGLYYNHMAPKLAYKIAASKPLAILLGIGRVLTLRPPLKKGQLQTLLTMKQLAHGDHPLKRISGYSNPLVSNVVTAIHQVPSLLPPLKKAIRYSSRTGNIPAFVHLDFDRICGGTYNWNEVKDILIEQCGWVAPDDAQKALHTSCRIERCKDHSQFFRFYHCQSKMIPFSAIELSLASRNCGRTKEQMLYEMEHLTGFSLDPIPECAIMCAYAEVPR